MKDGLRVRNVTFMSTLHPEDRQNSDDNVFARLVVGKEESSLVSAYVAARDFSVHTRRAIRTVKRVTLRDVTDFRDRLSREKRQAVALSAF
jgi:hypothetical protein